MKFRFCEILKTWSIASLISMHDAELADDRNQVDLKIRFHFSPVFHFAPTYYILHGYSSSDHYNMCTRVWHKIDVCIAVSVTFLLETKSLSLINM